MQQKCLLFGDTIAAEQVMNTNDPEMQQAIGKKAKRNMFYFFNVVI
jgi:hypothetical protein